MSRWFDRLFKSVSVTNASVWPPPIIDEPPDERPGIVLSPVAAPVHVLAGSALVRIDNGVLRVEREGEATFERPVELVSAVHIHGWATITSPCIAQLIDQGTPVVWRGATGYPIGLSTPMHQAGLDTRRAQYEAARGPTGHAVAQALVAAKINNMRGLVRRRAALPARDCLDQLAHFAKRALVAPTLETLLGVEGAATALYFAAWPEMIASRAGDLTIETRSRRPPQDEVNALLSYAYSVVAGECLAAVAAAGLDARQGFLHRPRAGRPALALDLMEPFRPLIADQSVLTALNRGQLKPIHFRVDGHAVLLTDDGRRLVIEALEQRLAAAVTLAGRTEAVSWRQAIGLSARHLATALATGTAFAPVERA